jgi:hypothetical protein
LGCVSLQENILRRRDAQCFPQGLADCSPDNLFRMLVAQDTPQDLDGLWASDLSQSLGG